jgi:hypothetical protein
MSTTLPERPDKMSESELRTLIRNARAEMRRLDHVDGREIVARGDELLREYERAAITVREGRAELLRREVEQRSLMSRLRRSQEPDTARTLRLAATWLGGVGDRELVRSRLDGSEAAELKTLVEQWTDLAGDDRLRAETLVTKAAGSEGNLFEDRRQLNRAKRRAAEALRDPVANSIAAAVFADPQLLMMASANQEAVEVSEFGTPVTVRSPEPVLEAADLGTLYIVLAAVAAYGGPILVSESGTVSKPEGVPRLELARVGHLRRNGWLASEREGLGRLVGHGPRVERIAERCTSICPRPSDEIGAPRGRLVYKS